VNVSPAAAAVWAERTCEVAGDAAQNTRTVFELVFSLRICAAFAKAQPAQPPLRMSSSFPYAGGAVEDTHGSCMMERRLQRKFEWTELPAVLAEGLLRLYGAGVELGE